MTPEQREAALRLAAVPICDRSIGWQSDATILLRELLAADVNQSLTTEPVQEPAQEPVAWTEARATDLAHRAGFAGTCWTMGPYELVHMLNMLNASPPQHQPLSDAQIMDTLKKQGTGIHWRLYVETVRAIEAAHGIGETK